MAAGTAVDQPRADREHGVDVARAVAGQWSLTLGPRELPLEELSTSANRPERITGDDEGRGAGGDHVTAPGADLLGERLGDSLVGLVGRKGSIDELGGCRTI